MKTYFQNIIAAIDFLFWLGSTSASVRNVVLKTVDHLLETVKQLQSGLSNSKIHTISIAQQTSNIGVCS